MHISERAMHLLARCFARAAGDEDGRERGDVPGWVLVTLMTAALVTAIWAFAEDQLLSILRNALDSVTPD
ncbi:MAG TPA: hypothetical protein VEZ46_08695 [Mycobacteriales bacterium]|jgi:hypothetical protein|nr:hypothetical protein [Mycobacteriales bacterium]